MTALSLNIASSKSIDFAGIPVESLPPLEAGRTLPQAFADALGKASKSAAKATSEGEGEGAGEGGTVAGEASAEAVEPNAKGQARAGSTVLPDTAATLPGVAGSPSEPGLKSGNVAATGKGLPSTRPAIAAAPEGEEAAVAATPALPAEATQGTDGGAPAVVASDPVIPVASQPKLAKASEAKSAAIEVESEAPTPERAETRPVKSEVESEDDTQEAPAPQVVATQVALPATGTIAITAGQVAVASEARGGPTITGKPAAKAGTALPPAASTAQPGENTVQTAQVATGEAAPKGESQTEAAPRQHSQTSSSAAHAPAGKPAQEAPQTGLSLQLRAAERPVAQVEAPSPATQGNTLSTSTQGVAASAPLPSTSPAPIVATTTAGSLPQFPELAELVDRIAAARHSAGSTTATIAVAHKELGNLSLTFEASGNKLDVEVAAQDSETQRSIAAAIAADRPHIRVGEMQAQAPAQTLHSQLASSAHGGGNDARQSGMAGDAQNDRRGDSRQSGRQPDSGQRRPGSEPKSDGGIYA